LLDEALGWQPQQRPSPRLLDLAVTMSTEMSFRQTSQWLGELVPGVSAMTVWSAAQRTGEQLDEQLREDREALEGGTLHSPGRQPVPELHLEGDGVPIGLQQTDQTRGEVKLATGYSGKRRQGARCELENRRTVAGLVDGQTIWEELTVVGGRCWDWSSVETVHVGGDGAAWVKQAVELFPQADYQLDVFHLRRALTEGLAFSQEHYATVTEALGRGDFEATMTAPVGGHCRTARGGASGHD